MRPFSPHALQLSAINSQRLQNQRRNLRRENLLRKFLRFCDSRTANEASYIPIIGAQTAVLFDLLFGGREDNSDLGLHDDVGHKRAIGGGTETWWFLVLARQADEMNGWEMGGEIGGVLGASHLP